MNKIQKMMLFSVKRQKNKRRIPFVLFLMAVLVCAFAPGINQQAYAVPYIKLTNGTASANDNSSIAYKAFDSNSSTYWMIDAGECPSGGQLPADLTYQLPSPQVVTRYRVTGYLASWTLKGSNDGSSWTTLHSANGSASGTLFNFSNTTAYKYYKIFGIMVSSNCHAIVFPGMGYIYLCDYSAQVNEIELYSPVYAPTASFSASPTTINQGASSTLTWSTTNATSVSFSPSIGSTALNGSKTVTPSSTTTYTMTATGPGGTITKTATVTVNSAAGKGVTYIYDELGRIESITRVN